MKIKPNQIIEELFVPLFNEFPEVQAAYGWDEWDRQFSIFYYLKREEKTELFFKLIDSIEHSLTEYHIPFDMAPLPELFVPEQYGLTRPFIEDVIFIKPVRKTYSHVDMGIPISGDVV
jgi:hypothetical protein